MGRRLEPARHGDIHGHHVGLQGSDQMQRGPVFSHLADISLLHFALLLQCGPCKVQNQQARVLTQEAPSGMFFELNPSRNRSCSE